MSHCRVRGSPAQGWEHLCKTAAHAKTVFPVMPPLAARGSDSGGAWSAASDPHSFSYPAKLGFNRQVGFVRIHTVFGSREVGPITQFSFVALYRTACSGA